MFKSLAPGHSTFRVLAPVLAGLALLASARVSRADDCAALGGVPGDCECVISSAVE